MWRFLLTPTWHSPCWWLIEMRGDRIGIPLAVSLPAVIVLAHLSGLEAREVILSIVALVMLLAPLISEEIGYGVH